MQFRENLMRDIAYTAAWVIKYSYEDSIFIYMKVYIYFLLIKEVKNKIIIGAYQRVKGYSTILHNL